MSIFVRGAYSSHNVEFLSEALRVLLHSARCTLYSSMLVVAGTTLAPIVEHPVLVVPQSYSYKVEVLAEVSIVHAATSSSAPCCSRPGRIKSLSEVFANTRTPLYQLLLLAGWDTVS